MTQVQPQTTRQTAPREYRKLGVHRTQVQPQTTGQTAPREYLATTDGGYLSQVHTQFCRYRSAVDVERNFLGVQHLGTLINVMALSSHAVVAHSHSANRQIWKF